MEESHSPIINPVAKKPKFSITNIKNLNLKGQIPPSLFEKLQETINEHKSN
jgi:hypothetical protein